MNPTEARLNELTQQRNALAQNGYILGYITASHPGNRPNFTQYHLREYGQKVGKYISKKRLDEVRAMVARGQMIKELDEAIALLSLQIATPQAEQVAGRTIQPRATRRRFVA
jgi:hypothetical protein